MAMAATQISKWISRNTSSSSAMKLLLFPSFRLSIHQTISVFNSYTYISTSNRNKPILKHDSSRRCMQEKVTYEKDVEDQSRVPDDVVELGAGTTRPDKPWTPNPTTGVFSPSDHPTSTTSSTPDQPIFSRPLDILDEPSTTTSTT